MFVLAYTAVKTACHRKEAHEAAAGNIVAYFKWLLLQPRTYQARVVVVV